MPKSKGRAPRNARPHKISRRQAAASTVSIAEALAEADRSTPQLIAVLGDVELWTRGSIMFGIPALRDGYPPGVKTAIDRRRRASLTGVCDCGARRRVSAGQVVMAHEAGCDAADGAIDAIAAQHGLRVGRWSP